MLYNITPEIKDRSKESNAIQKLFLKDNSIGKTLNLNFGNYSNKKLLIKFEIDTNPPKGSNQEIKYLDFPIDYAIMSQDLTSNFAGKCHALLCRPYIKGRDWYDFSWYVAKGVSVNFEFLQNAIDQHGPWEGQVNNKKININQSWLIGELKAKIKAINWDSAKLEVKRFININESSSLDLWS